MEDLLQIVSVVCIVMLAYYLVQLIRFKLEKKHAIKKHFEGYTRQEQKHCRKMQSRYVLKRSKKCLVLKSVIMLCGVLMLSLTAALPLLLKQIGFRYWYLAQLILFAITIPVSISYTNALKHFWKKYSKENPTNPLNVAQIRRTVIDGEKTHLTGFYCSAFALMCVVFLLVCYY